MALGEEWLGADSAILKCLRLGVALHHGALPTAYRKEVERLLRENILKVTISSPTLAQGLNLSATAVLMYSLHRSGERIEISEFKNVIGRAGRAYVDVEGIVLFPMFDDIAKKRRAWEALINDLGAREMESGLVRLVALLLKRMQARIGGDLNQLIEYVVNNAAAWTFPEVANEKPEDRDRALADWERNVATLDTAILSLIGENDIPDDGIEAALDDILQSSLWHRRLQRQKAPVQQVLKAGLLSRSRLIWSQSTAAQRRGYFLAGVGLTTGHALDAIAADANLLLIQANGNLLAGDAKARLPPSQSSPSASSPSTRSRPIHSQRIGATSCGLGCSVSRSPRLAPRSPRKPCNSSRAVWSIACRGRWRRSACGPPLMATRSECLTCCCKTMSLVSLYLPSRLEL